MKNTIRLFAAALAVSAIVPFTASGQEGHPGGKLRVYYFGNSLTGCTDPQWHGELGASVGKEWIVETNMGAGWQLWQHRMELLNSNIRLDRSGTGDLTIDHNANFDVKGRLRKFAQQPWDAIVLQPFSQSLKFVTNEMWGNHFDKPTDVGDIANAIEIIDAYLALNPRGKVFVYWNWPNMRPGKVPPEEEWPTWAIDMKKRTGKPPRTAEFPDRKNFDYEHEWVGKVYAMDNPGKSWLDNVRCRDFQVQLFDALKKHYPTLYQDGRLRVIPVGDIFLELHRLAKAGKFPGVGDIHEYYTDIQHTRGGLPRYTAAAAFYAALFEEHPGRLDWKLYNCEARYFASEERWGNGRDPHHDRGEVLEITAERAQIVHDTIWETLRQHPDSGLKK